jgi:LemA protein
MSALTILAIPATVVLLTFAVIGWIYNRLVALKNQLREAWSDVDVQLKRRHNLIPNLVDCVKGYRAHEQSLLESVAQSRSNAQRTPDVPQTSVAENDLSRGIGSLFTIAESYPDLKADKNFRQLSETLIAVENDIQYARRYYNGSVRDFNNLVQTFPSMLVARGFNFTTADFFELQTATDRNAPEVNL